MKNTTMFAAVLVLLVAGVFVAGAAGFRPFSVFDTSQVYMQPLVGSLTCERGDTRAIEISNYWSKTENIFFISKTFFYGDSTCSENIDQSGCTYLIKLKPSVSPSILGSAVNIYAVDSLGNSIIGYKASDGSTISEKVLDSMNSNFVTIGNIPRGAKITIYSASQFVAEKSFTPYVLRSHTPTGGTYTFNSQGCTVTKSPDSNSPDEVSQVCTGDTTGKYCFAYKDVIPFTESVNFIDSWVFAPIDMLPTLNGAQVACSAGKIYSIGTITTKDGTQYKTLDKILATYGIGQTYECCNGMETTDKVCNNWKWQSKSSATTSCIADIQCQQGQFAGGWNKVDSTHVSRGKCVSGTCNYAAETKKVDCTNNGQCSGTTPMCDVGNTFTCVASNGAIIAPPVGGSNSNNSDYTWLIVLVVAAGIGATLGYAVKKDFAYAGLGLFGGLATGFVINFLMANWLLVLVVVVGLGAVIMYFFGGQIISGIIRGGRR